MYRTPPAKIRRILRKEVNFACPVDECSSPYLTYHHFDPQWSERPHHNPEGMIALCLQHHKEADAGAFTHVQLRKLKKSASKQFIRGHFNWKRDRLFIIAGSNFFIGSPSILQAGSKKFIWFSKEPNGFGAINMDLFSSAGDIIFKMRSNGWLTVPTLDDIEAPPSANRLLARSKIHSLSLDISFEELDLDQIGQRAKRVFSSIDPRQKSWEPPWPDGLSRPPEKDWVAESVSKVQKYVKDNLGIQPQTVCELNLTIQFPVPLKLTPIKLEMNLGQSTFSLSGCIMPKNLTVLNLTLPAEGQTGSDSCLDMTAER
jgi:hypothetical protein